MSDFFFYISNVTIMDSKYKWFQVRLYFLFNFVLVSYLSTFICVLACTPAGRCPQIGSSWRLSGRQLGVPSVSIVQDLNC